MKAKRIIWLNTLFGFTYGLSLMGAAPLAAQDSCQPVNDAMDKTMTVPTHIYSTMNTASNGVGKPILAETIYTGGATYVKVASKWTRGPWTTQQVMKREQENRQKSKFSCHYLREESVNGETAAVYSTHSETTEQDVGKQTSDGQIWISKSRGLPLRHEFDLATGDANKKHHSSRYEYTNVQAPPL